MTPLVENESVAAEGSSEKSPFPIRLKRALVSARAVQVRDRHFVWIGPLEEPHYMTHAVELSRAIELLEVNFAKECTGIADALIIIVAHHRATMLKLVDHPSGETVFLGLLGERAEKPLLAYGHSKDICQKNLLSTYDLALKPG